MEEREGLPGEDRQRKGKSKAVEEGKKHYGF